MAGAGDPGDPPAGTAGSLEEYGVSQIGVFGSYARNEQVEGSDVDILVELAEPIGWDVVDLRDDLEHLLGLKVDLVLKGGVRQRKNLFRSIDGDIVYAQT